MTRRRPVVLVAALAAAVAVLLGLVLSLVVRGEAPPPPAALPGQTVILRGEGPLTPAPGAAGTPETLAILPADEAAPETFLWQARPVVVFADTAANPAFLRQIEALSANPGPLIARDVVVITDADPAANSAWRRMLRPEGFSLVLLDKDGQVKLRKPSPWDVREITRAIDKFPSRLEEIGRGTQ